MIAEKISKMISEQNLVAGDKLLNEFKLMQISDVGRGTVREADKLLASRNVLEIRRGNGTFVASAPGQIDDSWGLAFVNDS